MNLNLEGKLQQFDSQGTGMIKKGDFINVLFENIRGVQANELLNLIHLFTTSFEDVISYDDFLKILYKFNGGDIGTSGGHQMLLQPNASQQHMLMMHPPSNDDLLNGGQPHQDLGYVNQGMDQMNVQDGAGSSGFIQGKMRDVLLTKLRPREKDLTEKIRTSLRG